MAVWSRQQNQNLLDTIFGAGQVQAGRGRGEIALQNATPEQRAAYTAARQQFEGMGSYQPAYNGGVMPVGQVEPLNDYQRQALQTAAAGYNDPYSGQSQSLLDMVGGMLQQGTQGLTDQQYQAGIDRYMNPYQENVVNSTIDAIRRQAAIDQNNIDALFNNGSFASSAQFIDKAKLASDVQRNIGDTVGALNYQGYDRAANNTLNQFNQEAGRNLAGISGALAGAQGYQNLGGYDYGMYKGNLSDLMNAGNTVQSQNQRMLDVVSGQIQGVTNYPYTQLQQISSLLSPFSGSQNYGYQNQPSTLSQLGGAGMFLGGQYGSGSAFDIGRLF